MGLDEEMDMPEPGLVAGSRPRSRESLRSRDIHPAQLVRGSSSSSMNSLRRRRREDKLPAEPSLPGPDDEVVDLLSDTESVDGRRVRARHSNLPNDNTELYERTALSDLVPGGSQAPSADDYKSTAAVKGAVARGSMRPPVRRDSSRITANSNSSGTSRSSSRDVGVSRGIEATRHPPLNEVLEYSRSRASSSNHLGTSYDGAGFSAPVRRPSRGSSISMTSMDVLSSQQNSPISGQLPISRTEVILPRWQPDAEVTFCPICRTQFSFFVRKHHCRKCGRVVCNSCSPHRITIPYQFIVQPPELASVTRPPLSHAHTGSSSNFTSLGGGERVRLCNPCVPDPNIAPPQTPEINLPPLQRIPSYSSQGHSRSTSLATPTTNLATPANRRIPPGLSESERVAWTLGNYRRRSRESSILGPNPGSSSLQASSLLTQHQHASSSSQLPTSGGQRSRSSTNAGHGNLSQGHHRPRDDSRPLPRPPQLREEDECPVCHKELPSDPSVSITEALRESHINNCIENAFRTPTAAPTPSQAGPSRPRQLSHSSQPSLPPVPIANTPEARTAAREQAHAAIVLGHSSSPPMPIRRTGLFPYRATEKDCVDDAECTICLEEFEVGDEMARLECFCRFHMKCIRQWFELHNGQCPVHQHDAGY